jgi:hypothetical protein
LLLRILFYIINRYKRDRYMKMVLFWVVGPCSLVEVYQRFRGPCCLHHQGDSTRLHGATTRKTAIFILTAVRTWNLTEIGTRSFSCLILKWWFWNSLMSVLIALLYGITTNLRLCNMIYCAIPVWESYITRCIEICLWVVTSW